MTTKEMDIITTRHIDLNYPSENWIRTYTDGSAEEAVSNGGAGVYIEWPDGTTLERSFPTGKHSSNYKAEATALEEAADILSSPKSHEQNVVFLTDAKSVLQKLLNAKNKDQSKLKKNLHQLTTTANVYVYNGSPATATCLAMRKLTTWQKTVRNWNNWRKAAPMKKARPTSKQRFKNAGRNPTQTTTPETQSDGYQGNSKLQYSDYAQGTTGYDTICSTN